MISNESRDGPYVGVQALAGFSDLDYADEIYPQDWQNIGKLYWWENWELNYELKRWQNVSDIRLIGWVLRLEIGDWFGLSLNKNENSAFKLALKHDNGLFNNRNYNQISEEPILMNQWYQELQHKLQNAIN